METVDFGRIESEVLQNVIVVLSDLRAAPGGHFLDAMNLHGARDRRGQLPAGAFEWHNDFILDQLRIVDDFRRLQNWRQT